MNTRLAAVADLERRIGHSFSDRDLLERALTHGSVVKGKTGIRDNERLEFLGDRVLNLIVAEALMDRLPDAAEGGLSKLMNQLVNFHVCAEVARAIGLRDALRVDAGATKVGVRDNDRVLGDACEALIAALYLEAGLPVARAFVLTFWDQPLASLDTAPRDPKTLLQEWAMARGLAVPVYELLKTEGLAHEPVFTIQVQVTGLAPSTAKAGSKREAEKLAAAMMFERLEDQ